MEKYHREINLIENVLRDNPDGLSIHEIAEAVQLNRISVTKYLDILQVQGAVDVRKRGTAKVYILALRYPVSSLIKFCRDFYILFDASQTVIDLDPGLSDILEIPVSELQNKSIMTLPYPQLQDPAFLNLLRQSIRGQEKRVALTIQTPSREYTFHGALIPIVFPSGKPGVALIFTNKPDLAQGTGTCQDIEAKYAALISDQMEYVLRLSPQGLITFVNEAYCRDVGREREDLKGRTYWTMLPEDERDRVKSHLNSITPEQPVSIIDHRSIMASGELRWIRWKMRGMFDSEEHLMEYQWIGIDITDYKRAEDRLRRSYDHLEDLIDTRTQELQQINKQLYREIGDRERIERQLRLTQFAMDESADAILWLDQDGNVLYANKRAVEFLGYSSQTILSLSWGNFSNGTNKQPWDRIWLRVKKNLHFTAETLLKRVNGLFVDVEILFNYLNYNQKEYCYCFIRDITDRKRSERMIQNAMSYTRSLIDGSADPLFVIDVSGKIIDTNPAAAAVTGIASPVLLGTEFTSLIANYEVIEHWFRVLFKKGLLKNLELSVKRADGTTVPVLCSMVIIDLPEGEQQVVVSLRDISDRKEAIGRIREIDSRFRQLVDNIPEAFLLIQPQGKKVLYVSPAYERIFGYSSHDIYDEAEAWRKAIVPDDQPLIDGLIEERVTDPAEAEVRIRTPQGTVQWVHIRTFPVYDGNGIPVVRGLIASDISDRKHVEVAFQESLLYNRTLIEILPEPFFFLDKNGTIQDINPAAERLTGYSRDRIVGTILSRYTEDPERLSELIGGVLEKGRINNIAAKISCSNGTIVDVILNGVLYWDTAGIVIGILVMVNPVGSPPSRTTEF